MLNNKRAQLTWVIVIAVLLVAGFVIFYKFYNSGSDVSGSINGNVVADNLGSSASVSGGTGENYIIEITSSGFSPSALNISKGDSVTWVNKDSQARWPASASHPTHTKYAGASYDEEGSYKGSLACKSEGVAKDGAFDPCEGIAPGESWTFTFEQVGSWGFHDHLVSGQFGKITVQ